MFLLLFIIILSFVAASADDADVVSVNVYTRVCVCVNDVCWGMLGPLGAILRPLGAILRPS